MSKTISVVIICKNEQDMIGRCLDSVKGFDEYIVVDTGSKDNTVEILRSRGIEPDLGFVWIDDFCAAQNYAKAKATSDWILSIDCDECLLTPVEEVYAAVEKATNTVRVTMVAEGGGKVDFGFSRIFRNSPDIYWCASIHKHLNIPGEGEEHGEIKIMYGFSPAHLQDPDRSLRMLEHAVATEKNPVRNLYYLGREYYYKQRYQEAIETLHRYFKVAHWLAEQADAWLIIAQCYEAMRMAEECAAAILQAIKINSNFKEAIEYMALISIDENRPQWERMARAANNQGVLWKRTEANPTTDAIFLAPHNDDEALFGAFTLMREKPLVVVITDSFIQPERGDIGCDAETRRQETIAAMKIIGCPVVFLGIKDTELTEDVLSSRLKGLNPNKVYAPAMQGGNAQHDLVHKVAKELYGSRCEFYTTYTKTELYTTGTVEIKPTVEEKNIKGKMLACYTSQLNLPSTRPHFEAVVDKPEWLMNDLKKILICPYFGGLPEWIEKWTPPPGYDLLLDEDLEGFKKRVKEKLGIDYTGVPGSGKPWDMRCALGLLYEEEIKSYNFWGFCDFDTCWGDMGKFLPDSELMKLDVYSGHNEYVAGCFSLFRNTKEVKELFKNQPDWEEYMKYPEPTGWVETYYSRLLEKSGLRYKYTFEQGFPWTDKPELKRDGDGLFQNINGEWIEVMFYHFRHSKKWPL